MPGLLIFFFVAVIGLLWLLFIEKQEKGYARKSFRPKEPTYIFVLYAGTNVIFYIIDCNGRKIFYEVSAIYFYQQGDWLTLNEWITVRMINGEIVKKK